MNKILRIVMVGIVCIFFSIGMASAAEAKWEMVELKDEWPIQMNLPVTMVKKNSEKTPQGDWLYEFSNQSGAQALTLNVISLSGKMEKFPDKYPLDVSSDEFKTSFLATVQVMNPDVENYKYIKMKNGHLALMGNTKSYPAYSLVVLTETHIISIQIAMFDENKDEDLQSVIRIVESLKF